MNQIQREKIGQQVEVFGWVDRVRNLGGLIFVDLKDRAGILQLVIDPQKISEAKDLGLQDCIYAVGIVRERPKGQENPQMTTGEVELAADKLQILGKSKVPPFVIENEVKASEELRLRYRYLDLRRAAMQNTIIFRHRVITAMREHLNKNDFIEIETPILTRSMPEGARDYLVPSRLYPEKFYALAQSPQMYKQLLMVAGFERYYQIARCLRDEDPRHDRQPEHTQIDIEMSFVNETDIFNLIEGMFVHILKTVLNQKLEIPLPKLSYQEAIKKYGSDKPDLRFGMEIMDIKETFAQKYLPPFKDKKEIRFIIVKQGDKISRKKLDALNERARNLGLGGIYWVKKEAKFSGSIARFMDEEIASKLQLEPGNLLIISAGDEKVFSFLGELRNEIAAELNLCEPGFKFLWVYDFPLFDLDPKTKNIVPCHHIFTQPKEEDIKYLDTEPLKVRGRQYDLVCNGNELASGSIRNHNRTLQEKLFGIIGLDKKKAARQFGLLLNALEYGAPPHGGIAPGIDRIVMILAGLNSLREVIAFPKTTQAQGLLEEIPDFVDPEQLKELHIKFE